jgi:hypothetical protein
MVSHLLLVLESHAAEAGHDSVADKIRTKSGTDKIRDRRTKSGTDGTFPDPSVTSANEFLFLFGGL